MKLSDLWEVKELDAKLTGINFLIANISFSGLTIRAECCEQLPAEIAELCKPVILEELNRRKVEIIEKLAKFNVEVDVK
jgi:hypothetical protein